MHPILSDPRRLKVFIAAWTVMGVGIGVIPFRAAGGEWADAWAVGVWGEALAGLALASWYICRFSPLTADAPRVFLTVALSSLVTAGLWLATGWVWTTAVAFAAPSAEAVFAAAAPYWFVLAAGVMVVMCAVHYALAAVDDGQAAAQRAVEANLAAREAELRALRAQVNPHFLFNCLHSISALTSRDAAAARHMCLELADFFRDSLRAGSRSRISLDTEAGLVRRYLDIERVRFGDRLRTTVRVAADAAGAQVPPLLLQPLAENAVRHGIATLVDGGEVSINVDRVGDRVRVVVENPFDPDGRRPGTGVGLPNVRARVEASYPGQGEMRVETTDHWFAAVLLLPYEEAATAPRDERLPRHAESTEPFKEAV